MIRSFTTLSGLAATSTVSTTIRDRIGPSLASAASKFARALIDVGAGGAM
jgi:hypothetical protein